MGMRINTGSGIDPTLVDKLIEVERMPIKKIEDRKLKVTEESKLFRDLATRISEFGQSVQGLRNRGDFVKLKLDSSHPDILDGTVDGAALPGSYEIEVRAMAKTHKLLAEGFPDKDKTPIGFGYMSIELDDGSSFDIDIDPDASTLQDVARQINEVKAGAKAVIINTKENLEKGGDENFRLLVISEKSGKEARVSIDPDTTYLEFKEQITGRNLEMLFEDVPIYDEDNSVEALMPGLVLNAKRAEPGTKVTVKIDFDVDTTLGNISKFVEGYNKVNEFIEKQFSLDPNTSKMGPLARDNTLRTLSRNLKGALQYANYNNGKFRTLADIGITSDSKSGALKFDAAKAKQALAEDYMGVANLFVQSDQSPGLGASMSDKVRGLQNSESGVIASKDREYKRMLANFDEDIGKKERIAAQRAEGIKRRFAALEQTVSGLNAQGQAMQSRMTQGG